MRKLVYSALALGAAAAVSFGAGAVDANAADSPTFSTATLNGDTLDITVTGAKTILVGEAKVKKTKYLNVSAWDVYTAGSDGKISVDVSKMAKTKDHFIQVKADYSDDILATFKIDASDKITAKYDKTTSEINIYKDKQAYTGERMEYSTESGSKGKVVVSAGKGTLYSTLNESEGAVDEATSVESLSVYQQTGGVLYLQDVITPVVATPGEDGNEDTLKNGVIDLQVEGTNGEADANLKGYDLGKRPCKQVKLAIGKLANAPKVKANYVKGEITVPKGAAFRYANASTETLEAFANKGLTAAQTLKLSDDKAQYGKGADVADTDVVKDAVNATEAFAVQVQTPKSDKKPASKIGHFVFSAQDDTRITDAKDESGELLVENTENLATVESSNLLVSGELTTSGKTTVLTLTNNTNVTNKVDYVVTYTKEGVTSSTTTKLASGKTAKLTKIDIKQDIIFQTAGDAKNGTWPGKEETCVLKVAKLSDTAEKLVLGSNVIKDNREKEKFTVELPELENVEVTIEGTNTKLVKGENSVQEGAVLVFTYKGTIADLTGTSTTSSQKNKQITVCSSDVADDSDDGVQAITFTTTNTNTPALDTTVVKYIVPAKNVKFTAAS